MWRSQIQRVFSSAPPFLSLLQRIAGAEDLDIGNGAQRSQRRLDLCRRAAEARAHQLLTAVLALLVSCQQHRLHALQRVGDVGHDVAVQTKDTELDAAEHLGLREIPKF